MGRRKVMLHVEEVEDTVGRGPSNQMVGEGSS